MKENSNKKRGYQSRYISNQFTCQWSKDTQLKETVSVEQKTRFNYILSTETHFKWEDTYRIKIKEWRRIYHTNTNQKKARIALLTSDRADFRARKIFKWKPGHYIMTVGLILQKDIILNMYASKCVRQKLRELQKER